MNLTCKLSGLHALKRVFIFRLFLVTFTHSYTDTTATTTLAILDGREVHTHRGVDGNAFDNGFLTAGRVKFLSCLREYDIGNQPDPRGTLHAVKRGKVEQLNHGSIAKFTTRHVAVASTFVGRENGRDRVHCGIVRLDDRQFVLVLILATCSPDCTFDIERQHILAQCTPVLTHLNKSHGRTFA